MTSSPRPIRSTARRPCCATARPRATSSISRRGHRASASSYMLTEDGKTVARAAYGRYYMPLSIEFLRRFGPDVPAADASHSRCSRSGRGARWTRTATGSIDTAETRNAARKVSGLTPISEEERTIDQSWTLNVADGVKDQHTDEVTLNVEREVARNVSVSASYIFKHTSDLFANIPINRETGQEWEYERIPFTTSVRPAGHALQRCAAGLQRGRCDRRRRHRVDQRQQHVAGSRTCRLSTASSRAATTTGCSSC